MVGGSPTGRSAYTFGDDRLALERLRRLARIYEPSSRSLLELAREVPWRRPALAVDLACGPGLTTRLLAEVLGAERTLGLDLSEHFVAAAGRGQPQLEFLVHDVTRVPFPGPAPDAAYARFILTHLPDPGAVLAAWGSALAPGGLLVLEELHTMRGSAPVLNRYYETVAEMQGAHGQDMTVGRALPGLLPGAGLEPVLDRVLDLVLPGAPMAAVHLLNLRTWRHNQWVQAHREPAWLDELEAELEALAASADSALRVDYRMSQLILRRPHGTFDRGGSGPLP